MIWISIFNIVGSHFYFSSDSRLLGYEGVEVINPEGCKDDAEEEAQRGRWKQEVIILLVCFLGNLEGKIINISNIVFFPAHSSKLLIFKILWKLCLELLNGEHKDAVVFHCFTFYSSSSSLVWHILNT